MTTVIRDFFSRLWAHRKLERGQCKWCGRVLPDNATRKFCDDECKAEFIEDRHPVI
jgi:hypothetical protein